MPAAIGRLPRIARLMALAIKFDGMLREGVATDYADVARLGLVTVGLRPTLYLIQLIARIVSRRLGEVSQALERVTEEAHWPHTLDYIQLDIARGRFRCRTWATPGNRMPARLRGPRRCRRAARSVRAARELWVGQSRARLEDHRTTGPHPVLYERRPGWQQRRYRTSLPRSRGATPGSRPLRLAPEAGTDWAGGGKRVRCARPAPWVPPYRSTASP